MTAIILKNYKPTLKFLDNVYLNFSSFSRVVSLSPIQAFYLQILLKTRLVELLNIKGGSSYFSHRHHNFIHFHMISSQQKNINLISFL